MTEIGEAHQAITAALSLGAFRVVQPGDDLKPPAVVLGPPTLTWGAIGHGPTEISVPVWAVVANDSRAPDRLYEHLQAVAEALDASPGLVVITAQPGSYPAGGTDLPAYEITVEVET